MATCSLYFPVPCAVIEYVYMPRTCVTIPPSHSFFFLSFASPLPLPSGTLLTPSSHSQGHLCSHSSCPNRNLLKRTFASLDCQRCPASCSRTTSAVLFSIGSKCTYCLRERCIRQRVPVHSQTYSPPPLTSKTWPTMRSSPPSGLIRSSWVSRDRRAVSLICLRSQRWCSTERRRESPTTVRSRQDVPRPLTL